MVILYAPRPHFKIKVSKHLPTNQSKQYSNLQQTTTNKQKPNNIQPTQNHYKPLLILIQEQ